MLHRIVFIVKLIDMELVKILFCLRALKKNLLTKGLLMILLDLFKNCDFN